MNRRTSRAKQPVKQATQPHIVRRAIRYQAADNARQAIRRQFPDMFIPGSFNAATADSGAER